MQLLNDIRKKYLDVIKRYNIFLLIGDDYSSTATWLRTGYYGSESYSIVIPCFNIYVSVLMDEHNKVK